MISKLIPGKFTLESIHLGDMSFRYLDNIPMLSRQLSEISTAIKMEAFFSMLIKKPLHIIGVGMNNRLYTASLVFKRHVRWTYQGAHTCCIKSVAVQTRSTKLKLIGVGTNKQLYVKPKLSSGWGNVLRRGSVSILLLFDEHRGYRCIDLRKIYLPPFCDVLVWSVHTTYHQSIGGSRVVLGGLYFLSCEKFLNTIVCYRKYCRLAGMDPHWICT